MAKKFVIKEEYNLEEAGLGSRLSNAWKALRGKETASDTSSKIPAASAPETNDAETATTSSATPNYKSPAAIKALWAEYWKLRKQLRDELLYGGNDEKSDKVKFANAYLRIVHAPEGERPDTPEQAIQMTAQSVSAMLRDAGKGPTEPEAPDYSKMDTFGKAEAAVKDLKTKLSAVGGLDPKIIKGIVDSIMSVIHAYPDKDLFTLNEATEKVKTKTIPVSTYLAKLTPDLKKQVAQTIIDWASETYNYRLRIRVGNDLVKAAKAPRSRTTRTSTTTPSADPASTASPISAPPAPGPAESPTSVEPAAPTTSPSEEPEVRTNTAGAEVADEASPMDWDNPELSEFINSLDEYDAREFKSAISGIKYFAERNKFSDDTIKTFKEFMQKVFEVPKLKHLRTDHFNKFLKLALGEKKPDDIEGKYENGEDIEFINTFTRENGIREFVKKFANRLNTDNKEVREESLYEGLFDKFIKKQYKQSSNSPYKMIGKNKFKLL